MTKEPPPDTDKLPEPQADARFKRLVGNLVNTPHKPSAHDQRGDPDNRTDNRDG